MEVVYLVLIVAVLAFGLGVVVLGRRRQSGLPPAPPADLLVDRTSEIVRPPQPLEAAAPAGTAPVSPAPQVPAEPELIEPAPVEPELIEPELIEPAPVEPEPVEPAPVERASLRGRLGKARAALTGALLGIRGRVGITNEVWDELEEALLRADVGVRVTDELLGVLRQRVSSKEITDPDALVGALREEMQARLDGADRRLRTVSGDPGIPDVWLFVGVNGVGKTTTIGKVATQQIGEGRSVLMAAGDTFRAAAAEQLATWAERSGAEFVRGSEGGDPSSVIFDGVQRAAARQIPLVLADTAGRLHTKTNLMDELRKVRRVAGKGPGVVSEVLLVIDATTGQNGLVQAREFGEALQVADPGDGAAGITGVVLTKLDGSAKGGIVFAIETELGIPVKLVGVGETAGDLVPFDPAEFVAALFAED